MATITGVELARIGSYDLSTGPFTCTPSMLRSAVVAYASKQFGPIRLKLGHVDPRFDGAPALGRVTRLRLAEGGRVLLGDLEGVPKWLRDAAPDSYPNRSLEGATHMVAPDGSKHPFVLTGLALLGHTAPGMSNLAELRTAVAASSSGDSAGTVVGVLAPGARERPALTTRQSVQVKAAAARRRRRDAALVLSTLENH